MTLSVSKEAKRPMTLNKLFVLGAAVAALGVAAGAAFGQTSEQKVLIDAAKVQGVVGEQADGYLGFRTASTGAPLTQAVTVTNDARRRDVYVPGATAAGTTPDVAAARMFEAQLLPRIPAGQWYRNAAGQWVQR